MNQEEEKKSFEERLARLSEIVAKVEEGVLPIAEAMELFEEGNALIASLQSELTEAKTKSTTIRESLQK